MSGFDWKLADGSDHFGCCPDHVEAGIHYGAIYSPGKGYHTTTNDLILNLKKGPRASKAELRYKVRAIERVAAEMADYLNTAFKGQKIILVPIPPSKIKTDPDYDDRLERVAERIEELAPHAKARNLLHRQEDVGASHDGGPRSAQTAYDSLRVKHPREPVEGDIYIFDDVITTGAQFEGARRRLEEKFPGQVKGGIFLAKSSRD